MTVICWDGEVLAVDGVASYGTTIFPANKLWMYELEDQKYFAVGYGAVAGYAGLLDWYAKGATAQSFPYNDDCVMDAGIVVLGENRSITEYSSSPYGMEWPQSPLTWGCGGDIALGAMSQGANAIEAVKAACIHNSACGGDISWAKADSKEVQVLVNTTVVSWGDL